MSRNLITSSVVLLALAACTHRAMVHEPAALEDGEGEDVTLASQPAAQATADAGSSAPPTVIAEVSAARDRTETEEMDFDDDVRLGSEVSVDSIVVAGKSASGSSRNTRRSDRMAPARKPASGPVAATPRPTEAYVPSGGMPMPEPDPVDVGDYSDANEDYKDYGVNPFTMVERDAQSTFSIDVDTASYSIARRKLNEGALPSFASVRAEEFINYLDYDYFTPKNDPFAVSMEAMPDPFRPGHHILRVGVQGKEVSRDEREPLHLTFLVDVSGSMSSADKLGLAKKSLHMMVDGLREDDTIALATYAGRTARILEPTSAANKRAIHQAIEDLSSGGSTAMSAGIDIAYEMAWESFEEGHENRVIIMSDGDANVGRTSWDDMLSQIKGYADKGVTVSTIGFGMGNYKDTLMEQLANKGDGNNFYIDSQAQAQRVFVEELGGTLVTIARDVKIQVEFNDESVLAYRLIGYENRDIADKDFRNDRVDAGEVGSGHNVTALYDVILRDGYTRELATVRMRYEKPGADGTATEKLWNFKDSALKETPWLASRDTRIAYSSATFAEILRQSPNAAEISMDELIRFAGKSTRSGEKDDAELIKLMKTAKGLGAGVVGGVATSR